MEISGPKIKKVIFSKKSFFYISRKRTFKLQNYKSSGGNFPSLKNKNTHSEKVSYISRNETF